MNEHLHDLVAAYALDSLDEDERLAFEEHLPSCEQCGAELLELREAAVALGGADPVAPPELLKARVMAEIGRPAAGSASAVGRSWRERAFIPVLVALTAVSLALAGLLLAGVERADRAAEILAAEDTRLTVLEGPSTARLVYSPGMQEGLLVMSGVTELSSDQTFELWLIGAAGPVPAGIFVPEAGVVRFLVVGDFSTATSIGITIEPAGGSPQPTGTVIYLGALS